jgi:putative heme-binding domain-containing protein
MFSPRVVLLLIMALGCAASAQSPADPDSPAAERATFKVPDGFDVSLFASEADSPGLAKPMQIRFDARGRLWIINSTVYPQLEPGQQPDDKVTILEDDDGDGKSDKATIFERGLTIPSGLEIDGDGKGAFVGHGTQLLHLRDNDGDGIADERSVLFRGFGTGDSHQNINSFLWGPGGELWMCQGLSIRSRVETPWGIVGLNQAGVWRVYPRRQKLQGFYGSQNEPQNPWGVLFTDWGEPIVMAGNNSSPIYPVPGLVSERHRDLPPTIIWKNGRGRKTGGGDIVGTSHFPPDWQGTLIVGGYLNNAVWALRVLDDGAGFVLEDREPLITSTSTSFRPVDAKFGPDGALYVCDWYNPIIGHYQNSLRDPRRDKAHGRIWRITAKGRGLTPRPQLADAPIPQLLENLKSKDRWTRAFSKRVLASRPDDAVAAAVREFVATPGVNDMTLKEAIGVLQSHEVVDAALVERLSKSPQRGARAYAAGVIGAWADRLTDPLALLRPLADDADPRVRLQAIVACTYVQKPEAIEVALTAVDHERDKFIDYAIAQAVYALKLQWLKPFTEGKLKFDAKTSRMAALVRADESADTVQAVRALVKSPSIFAADREGFYRLLAAVGEAKDLDAILAIEDPAMRARLLPSLVEAAELRQVRPSGDAAAIASRLLSSPDPETQAAAASLAAAWKSTALNAQIDAIAADASKPQAVRVSAARALPDVMGSAAREPLARLAAPGNPHTVRAAAIAALTSLDQPAAAQQAAALLASGAPDAITAELFRSLLSREGAAPPLVEAFKATPPPADAAKIGLRVMSATGRRDDALATLLSKSAGLDRGPRKIPDLAAFIADVQKNGDPRRGAEVFARPESGCVACHAVAGKGGTVGPDLGAIGTAHPPEFIIGAILEPNREVREGYIAHEIVTKTGQSYQGYILAETPTELTLRDVSLNREVRVRQDSIKKRAQRGSVMPTGLADMMTDSEFRDLVRYLSELGRNARVENP